ncbi:unnamed protein product, partial [Prorocentrum cordatum]
AAAEDADLDLDDDDAGSEAAAREGLLALERGDAAAEMDVVDEFDDSWADVPPRAFAPPADERASGERAALVAELATLCSKPVDAALMALDLDHLRTYVELVRMQKSK